jgi:hypothetical protein
MDLEFIPYEKALALKELGFNELCLAYYQKSSVIGDDTILPLIICKDATNWNDYSFSKLGVPFYSAPTYSQAFRWFREKYGMKFYIRQDKWNKWCEVYIMTNDDMDPEYIELDDAWIYEEAELACLRKLIEIVKNK